MTNMTTPRRTRVELCGRLAVEIEGRAVTLQGGQPRELLAYLVRNRTRAVGRDELTDVLWPADVPRSPSDALSTLVARLRKRLGPGVLTGRSELGLELGLDAWIDVESAYGQFQRAETALERSDWREAWRAANLALGIADRGFLPEAQAPWADEERRRLEELRLDALECVAACGLGVGGTQVSVAAGAARALVASSPYRETGHLLLMQALAARGRVAEALRVYDRARLLLREDLGTTPGAELRSLHQRLIHHEWRACPLDRIRPARRGVRASCPGGRPRRRQAP